jgi:hypothetical protein
MARIGIFADESGNFDFSRGPGASRYFILTTVACADYGVGDALLRLRREIAWQGHGVNSEFHATEDSLEVRGRVFRLLCEHEFRIDVTILEKAKAAPCTRASEDAFYQHAWQHHLAHVAPQIVSPTDELFVVGASLGTKKKRALMHRASRRSWTPSPRAPSTVPYRGRRTASPAFRWPTTAAGRCGGNGSCAISRSTT